MHVRSLGVSFGNVRLWHDGLGEFSRELGKRLAVWAEGNAEALGVRVYFHLPERWHGEFGSKVNYLDCAFWQRIWHPRSIRFDLWHSLHQFNRFREPWRCKFFLQTVHDLNFIHAKPPHKQPRYMRKARRLMARSAALTTVSAFSANEIQREFNYTKPIYVIPNGVRDFSELPEHPPSENVPRNFLFHISRLAQSKNVPALLALAHHWPEMEFVIAGPAGSDASSLREKARLCALHNVHILTNVDDTQKAWLYRRCLGFLFPSLAEGFGLPVLEAMHFSKPVFAAQRTSLPEVGGGHAFYWKNFNPAHMRSVIEAGLASYTRDPGLAANARLHAMRFKWDTAAEKLIALYLSVLRPSVNFMST